MTTSKIKLSREQLIELCEKAVVPCDKWHDRDSYCAQREIASIYSGLKAGIDYNATLDESGNTIHIDFTSPTEEQRKLIGNYNLPIDSLEQYREKFGYDNEMFNGNGIDWSSNSLFSYMPSPKGLADSEGGDWY